MQDADLVVTGEGKMDAQTVFCKTPIGVALKQKNITLLIAICGSLGEGYQDVYKHGIDSAFSLIEQPESLPSLLNNAKRNMTHTAENIARLLKLTI